MYKCCVTGRTYSTYTENDLNLKVGRGSLSFLILLLMISLSFGVHNLGRWDFFFLFFDKKAPGGLILYSYSSTLANYITRYTRSTTMRTVSSTSHTLARRSSERAGTSFYH